MTETKLQEPEIPGYEFRESISYLIRQKAPVSDDMIKRDYGEEYNINPEDILLKNSEKYHGIKDVYVRTKD